MSGPPPAWQQRLSRSGGGENASPPPCGAANDYAALARDALDAHMPALLSRGGLVGRSTLTPPDP
jgi:hypothetical protein